MDAAEFRPPLATPGDELLNYVDSYPSTVPNGCSRAMNASPDQNEARISGNFRSRGDRTRTCNPRFWRPVHYQLCYSPSVSPL
jgi:hypothetical protein